MKLNIPGLIRDPLWQFVGALIAIVGLFYGYLRTRKTISYEIISWTPLLSREDEVKGTVQVLYEGQAVHAVSLLTLRIYNSGYIPIKSEDVEFPISISFAEGTKILKAEIASLSPPNLPALINTEDSKIVLNKILLNKNDSVTIKALVTRINDKIEVGARIVGVKSIKKVNRELREFVRQIGVATLVPMTVILAFSLINHLRKPEMKTQSPIEQEKALSSGQTEAKLITGEKDRLGLRSKYELRLLDPAESQLRISEIPRGVYGFTSPYGVKYGNPHLWRFANTRRSFEIHKLSDGTVYVVGFIGSDTAKQLKLDKRPKDFQFTLYADQWAKSQEIISLPLSQLTVKEDEREIEIEKSVSVYALDVTLR